MVKKTSKSKKGPSTSNEQECVVELVSKSKQNTFFALPTPSNDDLPEDENPQKKTGFNTSKRSQLIKMLCLTLLPILSLMGFTLFSLTDTINKKMENEKTRKELQLSVELGNLIHRLQQERDTSVLYLSALGPETKTFLLQEYIGTNNAIYALSEWPRNLDTDNREEFESRDRLREYLVRHRQLLTKVEYNLQVEIDFYTNIIRVVIAWLYDSITRGKDAEVWKTLVAYLKLTSGKQDVGIERALGTLFFVQGGFETRVSNQNYFEMYNTVIYRFRAFYETAELYSNRVDRLYSSGVSEAGSDLIAIIDGFRFEIQHYDSEVFYPDIQKARYWFDNMTLYLDTLLKIQQNLGFEIIGRLDVVIDDSTRDLSISVSCLVIVLIMCPLVIFVADNLTSSIQRYALRLVSTTKQLSEEHQKINSLIYQMVPEVVAKRFEKDMFGNAENIKSMTVMYFDVHDFAALTSSCSTNVVVELLTNLNNAIESLVENNEAFHAQTFKDSSMIVAGMAGREDDRHMQTIADISLELLQLVHESPFLLPDFGPVQLKIGINTGSVMSGITGRKIPRYSIFGEMVNKAFRMKNSSRPNHIHLTYSSFSVLQKEGVYMMQRRSKYNESSIGKGKGKVKTYWLIGKKDTCFFRCSDDETLDEQVSKQRSDVEYPGELAQYEKDTSYKLPLQVITPQEVTEKSLQNVKTSESS
ncbi:uncharacterized protein LOC132549352 [Ylistrum balloti]|uniref:uncharacterized protein LOC132549352 n=1 Tax=Ylistrum balloti TaxID=509963 RepID=UPI002905890C|nr:uncharacterized protein LOC132549352 [Ylistrum balloti]